MTAIKKEAARLMRVKRSEGAVGVGGGPRRSVEIRVVLA